MRKSTHGFPISLYGYGAQLWLPFASPELRYYLNYSRHVARLHRRRAYAPTSNTASRDNHDEKINSWVSFYFPYGYGTPFGSPFGPPELQY